MEWQKTAAVTAVASVAILPVAVAALEVLNHEP